MNVQSVSALFASYSAADGANGADFMNALAAATWQQVNAAHLQACTTSSARTQKMSNLHDAIGALGGLQKTKEGTRVVLGTDLASSNTLKAKITGVGDTLATDQSYNIAVVTTDASGNQVVGAKYVASAAERTAIASGKLIGTATADGVETRAVTSADGKTTTTYQVYTKEQLLTASQADVDALKATMKVQIVAQQKLLESDLARLQALGFKADDFSKLLTDPTRKRDKQVSANKQADHRENFNADAELRRKRNDTIAARDTRATKP